MRVSSVSFANWRNLTSASCVMSPGINVLWGMNAQGKSNILEGIYFFARGRSFRGSKEKEFIKFGEDFTSVSMSFRKDGYSEDTDLSATIQKTGKKILARNGATLASSSEMMGNFRAVLFAPSNLSLVAGGPLERRTFLDIAISQLSPLYLRYLKKYSVALAERNALIKMAQDGKQVAAEQFDVFSMALSEYGAWICSFRNEYVSMLNSAVNGYFSEMTDGREVPVLKYASHAVSENMPQPLTKEPAKGDTGVLYEKLSANLEREIAAGSTLWGIHKDDISISFNGHEAKPFASQGQQRSLALSMKLAEADISAKIGSENPVILLDDVFSELDINRRKFILDTLGEKNNRQIIITSCDPNVVPDGSFGNVNFLHVHAGEVDCGH